MVKGTVAKIQGKKPSCPMAGWEGAPWGDTGLLILAAAKFAQTLVGACSRALRSMGRCRLVWTGFRPFAKLNTAWNLKKKKKRFFFVSFF